MNKTIKMIGMVAMMTIPQWALAQSGGHVGGGDPTASDFQDFINEIDAYLLTEEGKTEFPELKQPEFHHIVMQVKPVVKDERVYDSFGVAQACVSHAEDGNRYFQCDVTRLPKIELNNQPTFYRIAFHELLFQAGLELPISKDVPSDFKISSRLKLRLKTYQKWIPGEENSEQMGFWCSTKSPSDSSLSNSLEFVWNTNGDFFLANVHFSRQQKRNPGYLKARASTVNVLSRGNNSGEDYKQVWGQTFFIKVDESQHFIFKILSNLEGIPDTTEQQYNKFPSAFVGELSMNGKYYTMACQTIGKVTKAIARAKMPIEEIFLNKNKNHFKFQALDSSDFH